MVAIADFHAEIVDQRLHPFLAAFGHDAQDVAGVSLLHREFADRLPFAVIGCKQIRSGQTAEHECDLPGEIVRVLHAGIAAEAAHRRHHMRGVADQKTRPSVNRSATSATARHDAMSSISTFASGRPIAEWTNATQRSR